MIKYFTIENFLSIKNENILEFDFGLNKDAEYISNPVIGFAGANASGKTTLLKGLTFVLWFMQNSFLHIEEDEKIPIEPFCTLKKSPTKFHIIFSRRSSVEGELKWVDYEYLLHLTPNEVLQEELYYYPHGRKRVACIRNKNEVQFGNSISEIQLKDLRANSSIISFAAQFESQTVALACKNYEFYSNVKSAGLEEEPFHAAMLERLLKDGKTKKITCELLRVADIGIEEIYLKKEETEDFLREIEAFSESEVINEEGKRRLLKQLQSFGEVITSDDVVVKSPFFKRKIDNRLVDFRPDSESAGTLKFLAILYWVIDALENGELIILDEIELKLHQNLVAYLIGLFENRAVNNQGGQLIFSFHNTSFMELLKPAQLWFAEKNDEGQTELFSAADFTDIQQLHEKNLERLYRIGRFGAKPRGI